jgi:UDP-N-acetylglucosamine 3-dehydrogenase
MKIGIVGYGSIGQRHCANARLLGQETIVYDPLRYSNDVRFEREVYEEADAVVIATPSTHHEAGLRACVERGKHCLIEKPISTSQGQLPDLLRQAREKDLAVMVGNNLRFHPCVLKAKEWLHDGLIGDVLWAQFTCATNGARNYAEGVILNTGSHEVDLALYLFGGGAIDTASVRCTEDLRDDMADFIMVHHSNARSSFHLDFVSPIYTRDFRIIGGDGMIYCDLSKRFLCRWQPDAKLPDVMHVENFNGIGSWDTDYLDEMSAFVDKIDGIYTGPGATGAEGLATLLTLLDVRKMAHL